MQQSEDNQKKDLVSMTKLYQQTKLPPRNSAPHTVQARIPKNKEMHIKSKIPPPRPPPRTEGRPPSEESEKVGGSSIPPQNSNTPSDSKEEKRIKIATEIYTSEKSYCKTLQVVVSVSFFFVIFHIIDKFSNFVIGIFTSITIGLWYLEER